MAENTEATAPSYHLVVVQPFGTYQRGDIISDAEAVADVLKSENAFDVNKIVAN